MFLISPNEKNGKLDDRIVGHPPSLSENILILVNFPSPSTTLPWRHRFIVPCGKYFPSFSYFPFY